MSLCDTYAKLKSLVIKIESAVMATQQQQGTKRTELLFEHIEELQKLQQELEKKLTPH